MTVVAADISEFAGALPRASEAVVRDRLKWRVGRIVFAALSRDETILGVGFPKEERAALVAAEPDKFRMPGPSDLRYQWIEVRLAAIDVDEMRELVLDGWRLCVPRKVSALIDGPADVGGAAVVDVPVERAPGLQSDEHGAEAAMARATPQSMTNVERELLASTERAELQRLGEDELADLLVRVRRARDKAVGIHRREVAAQVGEHAARGVASLPPRRSASKAELFEDALARTSTALGAAARRSAKELRDERLAASRGGSAATTPPANRRGAPDTHDTGRGRTAPRTSEAAASSTLATGARRQATRDSKR